MHDRRPRYALRHLRRKELLLTVVATTVGADMASSFDVDDLVGTAEIAEFLGLASSSVVRDWRRRHPDFPKPVRTLRMGSLWNWPAVEAWARSTGRLDRRA